MSDHAKSEAQVQDRLWDEIRKSRYGMLGLVGASPGSHFQPMTAFCEPENSQIWFFTRSDTDLARATVSGADAMFVVQAKDQAFQGCVGGRLLEQRDAERIERYWNPIVAAWYPGGKDDPLLTLLRFDLRDAQVWLSESNPVRFFWEIAKANLTHDEPDVGTTRELNLGAVPGVDRA